MEGSRRFLDPQMIVDSLEVQEGAQVADLGCGTGHLVLALARRAGPEGRIYAVDVDEEMISSARTYTKREGYRNVDFILADVVKDSLSQIQDHSLDFVFMSNLLLVLEQDKHKPPSKAVRLLKKGGRLIVIEWKKAHTLFGPPLHTRLDEEETKKIVMQVGFEFEQRIEAGIYHYGLIFKSKYPDVIHLPQPEALTKDKLQNLP